MKKIFLLGLLLIFVLCIKIGYCVDWAKVEVEEGKGFNEIVFGDSKCDKEFIKLRLGVPDHEEGGWVHYRKKYGLGFWFDKGGILKEIRLNDGFEGKLSSGITLYSSKEEVFKIYGKPRLELEVEDLGAHFKDRVLYKCDNRSKIFYKDKKLLFWFTDNEIMQIVTYSELM